MEQNYDLSIVLPVYNEVKAIGKVIPEIYQKIIPVFPGTIEMVVAEDGSTDGTKELLVRLQAKFNFRLVSGVERKGYNKAVKDALTLAQGNYVFLTDAGGAHEMNDFFKLYDHIKDHSVISGFKQNRNDPWYRVALSRGYNAYISLLFKHRFYDIDSGFKIYHRKDLHQILPEVNVLRECISTEILLRLFHNGCSIKEIPIVHYERKIDGPARTFSYRKIPRLVQGLFFDVIKLKKVLSIKNN